MMLLHIAWRNLWRNRRRSIIILTSIIVGVAAMDWMDGLARGFVVQMLENQLGAHTAHLQIHAAGFNDNKGVQKFMVSADTAIAALHDSPLVKAYSRRIVASGLLSSATNSSGVLIIGIDQEEERRITTIHRLIVAGRYIEKADNEVVISTEMAKTLDVGLGDRVVAMSAALDGAVGSDMFRIVGIYRSSSLTFDKMHVYVPLARAQQLLRVDGRVAELAVVMTDIDSVESLKARLRSRLGPADEVLTFRDLLPSLVSQMEMTDSLMFLVYALIGAALIFGIINSFLMAVYERIHEFGVLKSLGMKNWYVLVMIELEAFLLGVMGCVIGTVLGVGVVLLVGKTGLNLALFSEGLAGWGMGAVLYPQLNWSSLAVGSAIIVFICMCAALYPARRAMRLEPVQALTYV